jgi:hypothetical protein
MTHTKDGALKLALEALETAYAQTCSVGRAKDWQQLREAITIIKQARSAPVQPGRNHYEDGDVFERIAAMKKPPAAQPAPVPMAHIVGEIDHTGKVWKPVKPAIPDAIHHTDLSEHPEYISGWNDYRAAMMEMMK